MNVYATGRRKYSDVWLFKTYYIGIYEWKYLLKLEKNVSQDQIGNTEGATLETCIIAWNFVKLQRIVQLKIQRIVLNKLIC